MKKNIPKFEKKIYNKLDFTNEIWRIRQNYNSDNEVHKYFKLNDVKSLLKTINYHYEYSGENSHNLFLKNYQDLSFKFIVNIKKNITLQYFLIFKKEKFFGPKVTNLYSVLNHLPFDENLLNPNFNINSLEDLKKYILDLINLCNKFVEEYIKEVEAGNIPE